MTDVSTGHPDSQRLVAFAWGLLSPVEAAEVSAHLPACAECAAAVDAAPDDPFITLVRASALAAEKPSGRGDSYFSVDDGATPSESADTLVVPDELRNHPHYRIVRMLGKGGMGTVYKAEHRLMERAVALKVIGRQWLDRPSLIERFRREIKAVARLAHPNIVTAFHAEQVGGTHFLVMEFVEGSTLAQVVAHQGPLPIAQACDYLRQAALGLQHAFEAGLVHRDLKPQNLMLTAVGQRPSAVGQSAQMPMADSRTPKAVVKVLDFGLARLVLDETLPSALTASGVVLGTPDFLAPEQAADPHQVDIRADIYSLGCILYFLLTGRLPFPKGLAIQKVVAHLEKKPRPVTDIRCDVPAELLHLLDRLMAKDPADRPQTPAEVAAELAVFAPGGLACVTAAPSLRQRGRWLRFVLGAVGIVATVSVLAVLLFYYFTGRNQRAEPTGFTQLAEEDAVREVRSYRTDVGSFKRIAISADGRWTIAGRPSFKIQLWNLATGQSNELPERHDDNVMSLAFDADNKRALTGSQDTMMRLWDLVEKRQLKTYKGHWSWVRGVNFCPDGLHAVSAGNDGLVLLWNLQTGEVEKEFKGHRAVVAGVTPSRSGRLAVSGSWDKTARVWDLQEGGTLSVLGGHDDVVTKALFSPDSDQILTGSVDKSIRLWFTSTGKQLARLDGHKGTITALDWSPDTRWVLAGDAEGEVRLWDLKQRQELARLPAHAGTVGAVRIHPDGKNIITGGEEGVIRIWELPPRLQLYAIK